MRLMVGTARETGFWVCSRSRWRVLWRGTGRDSLFIAAGRVRIRIRYPWVRA